MSRIFLPLEDAIDTLSNENDDMESVVVPPANVDVVTDEEKEVDDEHNCLRMCLETMKFTIIQIQSLSKTWYGIRMCVPKIFLPFQKMRYARNCWQINITPKLLTMFSTTWCMVWFNDDIAHLLEFFYYPAITAQDLYWSDDADSGLSKEL